MSETPLQHVRQRIADATAAAGAGRTAPRLLAVSKTRDADAVGALARQMGDGVPRAFGENYVQEAAAKIAALAPLGLEWHLIGHLQSNKTAQAATLFDWVQTVDRAKLVPLLATARPPDRAPLQVLLQVNIDDEASKHGCAPAALPALAELVAAQPRLALRGLMAIPAPRADDAARRPAFAAMRALFDTLRAQYASVDTLSMGMSDDLEAAIAERATMVRVGTALFGPRQ